LHANELT